VSSPFAHVITLRARCSTALFAGEIPETSIVKEPLLVNQTWDWLQQRPSDYPTYGYLFSPLSPYMSLPFGHDVRGAFFAGEIPETSIVKEPLLVNQTWDWLQQRPRDYPTYGYLFSPLSPYMSLPFGHDVRGAFFTTRNPRDLYRQRATPGQSDLGLASTAPQGLPNIRVPVLTPSHLTIGGLVSPGGSK
jgi:hypothetical protein